MPQASVLIIDDRQDTVDFLRQNVLVSACYRVVVAPSAAAGVQKALEERPDLMIINLAMFEQGRLWVVEELRKAGMETPLIAIAPCDTEESVMRAYQLGARQYIVEPFTVERVQKAVAESIAEHRLRAERERSARSVSRAGAEAERWLRELRVLAGIGKSVISLLDEDQLMGRVVDAAVYLTGAEEGFLLLLDDSSGELHLRAAREISERSSRHFRLQVGDSLARQVVQTGEPVIFPGPGRLQRSKGQNGYPMRPLIHVPLQVGERVLGVLSVDHKAQGRTFTARHLQLLSTLADLAAIALDHGRLRESLRAQPPDVPEPPGFGGLNGVLGGLHEYQEQVEACIESVGNILARLREQVSSLETRLVQSAVLEKSLLGPGDLSGVVLSARSEDATRSILDSLSDGVLIVDVEGRVQLANRAASVMLGRPLVGQRLEQVCQDPRWSDMYETVRTAAQTNGSAASGDLASATAVLSTGTGMLRAQFRVRPFGGSASVGTVIVLRDVTAEREAQRAKESLGASLSQKLRTPMTSIGGYADSLLSESAGSLTEAQQAIVRRIGVDARQIDAVLEELAGKDVQGRWHFQRTSKVADLQAVIHDACGMMRPQMAGKDQTIELNLDPNLPGVQADGDTLFCVLADVLQNAHQCSPDGARIVLRAVNVRASWDNGGDLYVAVSVADRGGGIAAKDRRRVFDRLCRLENPVVPGLVDPGFSLPMVKALVEAIGGRVWLDSTPGVGSVLTLLLPVLSSA
jgi:signal transduction histidine kinase/GAF domain-containing protein/DNA-binding NarL/FixJ family response regulator